MAKRVWDDFLTPRDKASIGNRRPQILGLRYAAGTDTEAAHAVNLFDLHQKHADVPSVNDVVPHLSSLP